MQATYPWGRLCCSSRLAGDTCLPTLLKLRVPQKSSVRSAEAGLEPVPFAVT